MLRVIRNSDPREKPPYGAVLDPYHPLTQGLVGCWLFNEGGGNTAYNLAYVDRAILTNGPIWTPDGGVKTDDATNYIRILDPESRYSVDEFTLEVDLVVNSAAEYDRIVEHKQDLKYNSTEGWTVTRYDTTRWIFTHSGQWDGSSYLYIQNAFGERLTVVLRKYAGVNSIDGFKNGVWVTSQSCGSVTASAKAMTIAHYENESRFTGLTVYRLRFWNRALSDGEILQAYEEPYVNLLTPYRVFCSVAGIMTPSVTK